MQLLLNAPVLVMLWRLAGPNVLAVGMLTAVTFADAWYVGQVSTAALASLALVFPFQTLMQMMAGGAIGGGVTSAVARALGADDTARAENIAWHSVLVGVGMSFVFLVVLGLCASPIFSLLDGSGNASGGAVNYAYIAFGGATAFWGMYILSAVLRGVGDTTTPARAITIASIAQIALSGTLTLGWGGLPALGIVGPAVAMVVCHGGAALYLYLFLCFGKARIQLRPCPVRWIYFKDILQVGGIGLCNSAFMALNVVFVTGLVGRYGLEALAGYGLGARLELMLVPIAFGIGAALTAAVGANVGAGQFARARRIAWTGGGITLALTGVIGLIAALKPELWLNMFTEDASAFRFGALYLGIAAPFYGLFGAGQALYFASQGTGRLFWPVFASGIRFLFVVGLGALVVSLEQDVTAVFWVVAGGLTIIGVGQALCLRTTAWRGGRYA